MVIPEEDYEVIRSSQTLAAEFRAKFDHLRHIPSFPVHFGYAVLYKSQETDKYEICPCESVENKKYKFCCWERTKSFRQFLKNSGNKLFIYKEDCGLSK